MNATAFDTAPQVAVLILNYCSLADTLACVECVRRSDYPNVRVLVIDNASPDGGGVALAARLPAAEFVGLPRNTGYAGGNNEGIRRAMQEGAQFMLILNPDVRLPANAISTYVRHLVAHPEVGALNSLQVGEDGQTLDEKFRTGVLVPCGFADKSLSERAWPVAFEAGTLFGAALMLTRAAIEKVGGFDPLFFAYGEETDLCRRLCYHGFKLAVLAEPPVIHLRTKHVGGISPRVTYLMLRGYYLGQIKNPFTSASGGAQRAFRDLFRAAFGRRPEYFPFDTLDVRRSQAARALLWFATHLHHAWSHKQIEKRGRAHV